MTTTAGRAAGPSQTQSRVPMHAAGPTRKLTVFMMDLWATVPYYTAYLSRALLAAGTDVMVGSISYYLDPGCFSSRGIRLQPGCLDIVGKLRLSQGPRRLLKFAEALLNMTCLAVRFLFAPPAVVHVQYLPMLRWRLPLESWFLGFCRFRGAAVVLTIHDLLPHDTADKYKRVFEKLYRGVDAIICHSEHVKARAVAEFGVKAERVFVIPHGPFFYDLPDTADTGIKAAAGEPVLVLWQGIIFPYKGVAELLSAWKGVEARVAGASLLVVGTGSPDLLRQIETQVGQLGLERVRLDFRFVSAEELVARYRAADIVVYPYSAITTSGALATGLALGKTIVASDLPVFRELLQDRHNALLVPAGDKAALAEAISELAQSPDLRARLAAEVRGMNFGEQSWRSIAEKTQDVYRHVLHSHAEMALASRAVPPASAPPAPAEAGEATEL